jgi:hypothetical protein
MYAALIRGARAEPRFGGAALSQRAAAKGLLKNKYIYIKRCHLYLHPNY